MDVKDLAAEVEHLRAELEAVSEELEIERAHRNILQRAVVRLRSVEGADGTQAASAPLDGDESDERVLSLDGNMYVFDDEDASRAAFDEFFATPDPHLDKVRGFLLD